MYANYKAISLIFAILVSFLVVSASDAADIVHKSTLTDDWNGAGNQLEQQGITLSGDYVS